MNTFHIYFNKFEKGNVEGDVEHLMGDRKSIFALYLLLKGKLNYSNITVRDSFNNVVDMSKGLLEMPLYSNNCFIDRREHE